MASAPDPWAVDALLDAVAFADAPERTAELVARLPSRSAPRSLSVTDVLAPRRAFWRRLRGPAPTPIERELRLEQGRRWHRGFGDALAGEGSAEVRVRRDGLTARIDVLAEVPIEVKTGSGAPAGAAGEEWPDQVEQLAAYCALAGSESGRLVHLAPRDGAPPTVSVGEFRFRGLDEWLTVLLRRRDALRTAIESQDATSLGRCRWLGKGCEYRACGICSCSGDEPAEPGEGPAAVRSDRGDLADRWAQRLAQQPPEPEERPAHFRDLLNPRRSYFDRTRGRPTVAHAPRPPSAPMDAFERAHAALEAGAVGSVHRLLARPGAPTEEIVAWGGDPCLVRSSRIPGRRSPEEVRARTPQYLLELGFRCGLTDRSAGTLVVASDAGGPPSSELQVFRLDLRGRGADFARTWEARRRAVERAVAERAPERLPPCPGWMARDCPYRDACGCGVEAGRSHR